jgi:hypothetical protein
MITVKRLREVLEKFPDDSWCNAYEGEAVGIVIAPKGTSGGPGFIYCAASDEEETKDEYFPDASEKHG